MSESLSKSLHDFLEGQSRAKTAGSLRSAENVSPNAEILPNRIDELIKSEKQTLSNDKLVEGYVVIRLEDETSSSAINSSQRGEREGDLKRAINNCNDERNNFTEETNSCCEANDLTADIETSSSRIEDNKSRGTSKTPEVESVEYSRSDNVESVVSYDNFSYDGAAKTNKCDSAGEIKSFDNTRDKEYYSIEQRFISHNTEGLNTKENPNENDDTTFKIVKSNGSVQESLITEKTINVGKANDIENKFDNIHNAVVIDGNSKIHLTDVDKCDNEGNGNEIYDEDSIWRDDNDDNEADDNDDEIDDGRDRTAGNTYETGDNYDELYDKNTNDLDIAAEIEKNIDENYCDLEGQNCDEFCGKAGKEIHNNNSDLDEDNDNDVDKNNDTDDDPLVETDGESVRSESDTYETCDECTDDECKQENTQSSHKTFQNTRSHSGVKASSLKPEEYEVKTLEENTTERRKLKNNLLMPKKKNCRLTPFNDDRSCYLTDHPVMKYKGTKRKTDILNQNTPAVINVSSGVLGDGVRPDIPLTDDEDNLKDITPETADAISRLQQYSAELECPTAATGKLTETPRYSSVVQELGSRTQSGAATELSILSGRKNPQAKLDSEIRDLERKARVAQSAKLVSSKRALPPIKGDLKTLNGGHQLTKTVKDASTKNTEKDIQMISDSKSQRKPAVPKLLQSSVCYHDGKVDVSIYSERGLINQSDPVHLNINFVRQPLVPATSVKSAGNKTTRETNAKLPTRKTRSGVTKENGLICSKKTPLVKRRNFGKMLSPIENPPRLESTQIPRTRIKKDTKNKATIKRKKRVPYRCRELTNIWSSKFDDVDWNIVERRAQKPPFNTHIDPEASLRHMKFFMDF